MSGIYKPAEGQLQVEQQYRKILKHWPVANRQFYVPTRQGDTFVIACGEEAAPPVVLLHGSLANSAAWMGDVGAWAERLGWTHLASRRAPTVRRGWWRSL